MSNVVIPYTFVPGTKAKAQEINANFVAVADKIQSDSDYTKEKFDEIESNLTSSNNELSEKISTIETELSTKAESDGSNLKTASTSQKGLTQFATKTTVSGTRPAVVVSVYYTDTAWYRLWSDNWLEQGGIVATSNSSDNEYIITYPKAFGSTNYQISFSAKFTADSTISYIAKFDIGAYASCTTTTATIKLRYIHQRVLWHACGYAA